MLHCRGIYQHTSDDSFLALDLTARPWRLARFHIFYYLGRGFWDNRISSSSEIVPFLCINGIQEEGRIGDPHSKRGCSNGSRRPKVSDRAYFGCQYINERFATQA